MGCGPHRFTFNAKGHPMIPVFFRPEMVAPATGYSPSAAKPAQVVADWRADFDIAPEIEFFDFDPATRAELVRAHDADYVDGILAARIPNGFGNRDARIAASLPFTSGSLLAAARHVLANADNLYFRPQIACSPTSGFHHAHYGEASGYCTFNGLMVTALALKAEGLVDRVLILDCDQHYGDGTQDIIETLGLDWVTHVTHSGALPGSYRDKQEMVEMIVRHIPAFARHKCRGLVLYQAGADCHVDDPLGGFLTADEMRQRDRLVFETAVSTEVPVVWNLAGGYQRDAKGGIAPVLALHRQTMIEAIGALAKAAARINARLSQGN
jgi:acetoin utilization deacetylase AcuC-like enzyme